MIQKNSNGINAEQSVLGAVFLEPAILDELVFLEDRDFSSTVHAQIYKTMRFLEKKSYPVDIITVSEVLGKMNVLEGIGGVSYLTELATSCPTAANATHYAEIIRSHAIERRAKSTAEIITTLDRQDFNSDEEYFSKIEGLISTLRPQESAKMKSISEIRTDYFEHLKKPPQKLKTGFEQFDKWSGYGRGWLVVNAGRPSVGKTAHLLQTVQGIATHNYNPGAILVFSQEMKDTELIDRWISNATGISYGNLLNRRLTDNDWAKVEEAYEKFESMPIHVQDSAGITIEEVKATAKLLKKKYGKLAVIAVDYLQIMKIPKAKGETRAEAIGRVTGEAKQIARELDCVFIMLSQMSRESEKFGGKPMLSHLKESGSIEQDADMVQFLWHDPNDTVTGGKVIQQTVAKGRSVGLNEFRLLFKGWLQQFSELPKE